MTDTNPLRADELRERLTNAFTEQDKATEDATKLEDRVDLALEVFSQHGGSMGRREDKLRERIAELIYQAHAKAEPHENVWHWLEVGQHQKAIYLEHAAAILALLTPPPSLASVEHLRDILMSAPKAGEPDVTGEWYAIPPNLMGSGMDAVRSIRSALTSGNGWRDIESAPKGERSYEDGPRFVAWGTMRGEYGYTEDETKEFFAKWSGQSRRFILDQPGARYSGPVKFTHWMPLPDAPQPKTGDA
jgi:hypothetical protein